MEALVREKEEFIRKVLPQWDKKAI